jgi:hypothetical protein
MSRTVRQSQYTSVAQKAINADNAARANTSVSSSYAATASVLLGSVVSASYAATSSYSTTLGASLSNNSEGTLRLVNSANNTISSITALTASLANTASYINPTFISASAAASGFGSGINDQLIALTGSNVTTTSATAVDVTGLVTPTLPANSTWSFEIYLSVTCSGTGGLRFGFTAPSGADGALFIVGTATTAATSQQTSTTGALAGTAINRAATSSLGKLYGRVIIGANAGAVQLQFASATGGQTSTIVGTGISIMRITRVA